MYLCVSDGEKRRKVFFRDDIFLESDLPSESLASPIFPVDQSHIPDLSSKTNLIILFCYIHHPYSAIGNLCGKLNDERIHNLWFTHGLASLLVISQKSKIVTDIKNLLKDEWSGWEQWKIKNGELFSIDYEISKAPHFDIEIPDVLSIPPDVRALINEYISCIRIAMHRAAIYFPDHLRILRGIHSIVYNILGQLNFFLSQSEEDPNDFFSDIENLDLLISDPGAKIRYVHLLVDQLLQVNSALSYVITQGYAGISPILQHECPIRSFSLLGIGTAFAALVKIYESVSRVFARYPIPRAINDSYTNDYTKIPIFKNYAEYDADIWRQFSTFLDGKLKHLTNIEDDQMCHLVYFSGKQGYREAIYGISAAIQSLFVGASLRWSVLTLTHEFLHAHVRAIMAVLFPEKAGHSFTQLYDTYQRLRKGSDDPLKINAKNSLALIILAITESMIESNILSDKIKNGKKAEQKSITLSHEQLFEALKDNYKNINEFLVHALDYLYFYEANRDLYIKLIWLTWATIPEIQERLPHYLLRTILTVSIDMRGTISERFDWACAEMKKSFNGIIASKSCENDFVIREVLAYLEHQKKLPALKAKYAGCIRLTDMARYLLHSNAIHHDVKEDDLKIPNEDGIATYAIETYEFQDQDIKSPIAFIVDRIKSKLDKKIEKNFESVFQKTCWELLVIGSANL